MEVYASEDGDQSRDRILILDRSGRRLVNDLAVDFDARDIERDADQLAHSILAG